MSLKQENGRYHIPPNTNDAELFLEEQLHELRNDVISEFNGHPEVEQPLPVHLEVLKMGRELQAVRNEMQKAA